MAREHYRAYVEERRQQLHCSGFAYWVYRAEIDCPDRHQELDGLAQPPEHPFWQRHYPPLDDINDCACYVVGANSEAGVRRLGGDTNKALPDWVKV